MLALAYLTSRHPAASEAQASLVNAGAVGQLFRLLTPAASTAAAALARNLMLSASGREAMTEQINVLVTLLSGPACTDAAAALWLLSRDPANNTCEAIIRHGAIPAACRVLYEDNALEAQCSAAALLWQLTQTDPSAVAQLDQEGIAAPLTQLLHSADQSAATYAAALLRRLSENRPAAFRQRMNTELAQSLQSASASNIGMSQSVTFPNPNTNITSPGGMSESNIMLPTAGTQSQPQMWLDTDL